MSTDIESVAAIIVSDSNADFIHALMAANGHFSDPSFEDTLAAFLRTRPDLVDRWATYSTEQRWTPAAYVTGTEAGWYGAGYDGVVHHPDEAAAVADFIHRTASYLNANVPRESDRDL